MQIYMISKLDRHVFKLATLATFLEQICTSLCEGPGFKVLRGMNVLYCTDRQHVFSFSRRMLTGSLDTSRTDEIPALTVDQAHALDALHACAAQHKVAIQVCAGDMVFINNLALFHARTRFEDSDQSTRHALQLWMRDAESGWKIPSGLSNEWEDVFDTSAATATADAWNVESIEAATE